MEVSNDERISNSDIQLSCNWRITNNKQFHDAFTVIPSTEVPKKTNFEDMVFLNTCICLEPIQSDKEPCLLDIRLSNRQRISHIAVVSEAYVLEFFKEAGEYEITVPAELVDEFEGNTVYFAETPIAPATPEAHIKFARRKSKNSVMWIYGIRLYLTQPTNESDCFSDDLFKLEIIRNFLTKVDSNDRRTRTGGNVQTRYKTKESNEKEIAECTDQNSVSNNVDIKGYIDNKFHDMEIRMMKRIDEMERKTNEKLDIILKQLETQFIVK